MRKNPKTYAYKPSNRDVLYCLLNEPRWLHLLKGKIYNPLLDYLINVAPKSINERVSFTIKEISEVLNEKRIHKWLPMIADDLIQLNQENPHLFKIKDSEKLYELYAFDKYSGGYINFYMWTDSVFHEGETFNWYFSKLKISQTHFWIKSISHKYERGEIITTIKLEVGYPNKYRAFLLDKADFEDKISWDQQREMDTYQMDDFLRKLYR